MASVGQKYQVSVIIYPSQATEAREKLAQLGFAIDHDGSSKYHTIFQQEFDDEQYLRLQNGMKGVAEVHRKVKKA